MASISVVDAAREAVQHTRRHLFPVRPLRWLALGFLAFLDQCGRSMSGGGPVARNDGHDRPWPGAGGSHAGGDLAEALRSFSTWLSDHAVVITLGVLGAVLVVATVMAIVLWINARGTFMYLDNVATGRADVARPWREHERAAWSYFGWRLALGLGIFFVLLMAAGVVAVGAMAFARGRLAGSEGGFAFLAFGPALLMLLLALPLLALAHLALRDFVAPLQMVTGLSCGAAARLLETLLTSHPGAFLLYLLLKILLFAVTGVVVLVGGCLTCCIAFLPVVMQTVFQPLFYFERAWPLFLLRQLGYDLPGRRVA
jgi:hypothetical protein